MIAQFIVAVIGICLLGYMGYHYEMKANRLQCELDALRKQKGVPLSDFKILINNTMLLSVYTVHPAPNVRYFHALIPGAGMLSNAELLYRGHHVVSNLHNPPVPVICGDRVVVTLESTNE